MNTQELINALRSTQSRSKRALLDAAADTIEALLADLRDAAPCPFCKYYDCLEHCVDCGRSAPMFEWRGVKEKEAPTPVNTEKAIKELQRAIDFGPGRLISVEALQVAVAVLEAKKARGVVKVLPKRVKTISCETKFLHPNGELIPTVEVCAELARELANQLLHSPVMQTKVTATTSSNHQLEQVTIRASVDVLVPEKEAET